MIQITVKPLIHATASIFNKWFLENYGRNLVGQFLHRANEPKVILDLGAGEGDDLKIAKGLFPKADLWAIERHPPNIQKLESQGIRVTSLDIERDRLPFSDGSVDIVIINQVLEHTKDIFWILHESARVLRHSGLLVVGVPNLAGWHNRIILLLGVQPPAIASLSNHIRGFTHLDLRETIEVGSARAMIVTQSASAGFYPFPPSIARFLNKFLPTLGWSVHLCVEKTGIYQQQFLTEASRYYDTNFFVGGKST